MTHIRVLPVFSLRNKSIPQVFECVEKAALLKQVVLY